MAYIGRQLARGENKLFDDISSSFNGSTTTFNLTVSSVATATATPYQLFVSLGGVMQKPNTDFTTAGNQITFTTAPAAGLSCWIMMQGDTIDQAAIPDASVTPSKISGSNFAFSGDLRLKDADGSHYVGFASPTTVASNKVWTLPAADGSASQYLQTNGSGVLTWASVTIGGATGIDFNDNVKARWGTGNDLEIFHNASNSVINDAGTGDLLLQVGGTTKATVSSTGFDITGALTVSTNAVITGNLTVSGTTTTINTQTLDVEDKNVVIGKVSSPSDTTADGGGWTLKGSTDKTLNWVNATDAWTSSEHIHLIDNKKLFVGGASGTTDGLEIVHDGSNSILNDTGTGTLKLQLGGSTKLEVTSGGVDVTGAITVDGSPLSSLPTIDLVADGAIAAGKAVCLTSAGKATQVRYQASMQATPSMYIGYTEVETSGANCSRSCWDPDLTTSLSKGVFWSIYIDGGDSDKVKLVGATNDGWPQNYGDLVTLNTGAADGDDVIIDYDTQNDKIITAYRIGNVLKARTVTATNITTANITANTELTISNTGHEIAMAYGTSGKFLIMYSDGINNTEHYCKVCTVAANGTISQGGAVEFANSCDIHHTRCVYASNIDKFLLLYTKSNDSNNAYCRVATISGTSVSYGTEAKFCGDDTSGIAAAWDSKNQKFAILYNGSNDYLYGKIGTVSGTSISFGSGTTFAAHAALYPEVAFSTLSNSFVCQYKNPSYSGRSSIRNFEIDGSSFNITAGVGNNISAHAVNKPYGHAVGQVVFGTGPDIVGFFTSRDSATHLRVGRFNFLEPGSNMDSNKRNFIGFSPSAVNDGATGTFNMAGNTIGSQSGLTVGEGYAVQNDGTMDTTLSSNQVGFLALTSTTGLIKGY